MKDRVFIGWSGSNKVAVCVKHILESKYNYVCSIGGNADNASNFASVGDTVIQQMKTCNQAIIIFQNRDDGSVSNNLFFELGYALSTYGMKKIHCVKKASEKVILPSDFDNSFVEPIADDGSAEDFAEGIIQYFLSRQKMSINENKMYLINNRYLIHDIIRCHYSESGSKCSDYELAQYLLFYMQAAHIFSDERKIYNEIYELRKAHMYEFSHELSLSVNICLTFFELIFSIKQDKDTGDVYTDGKTFWKCYKEYRMYASQILDDDIGIFDEWAKIFVYEQLTFIHMLFANNPENSEEMKKEVSLKIIEYANETIKSMDTLELRAPCIENNDNIGLISLLKAYIYRNLFIAKNALNDEDAEYWLKRTLEERAALKNNFGRGTVDTALYNNICMEYYLSLVNYLEYKKDISPFEKEMYKQEMSDYLESVRSQTKENAFVKQISHWYNNN